MQKLVILFSSLIMLLMGCASQSPKPPQVFNAGDTVGNGLVVFSVKYNGPNSGYDIHYRGLDFAKKGTAGAGVGIALFPTRQKSDFEYSTGKLHVLELPVGKYEFYAWSTKSGMANLRQNKPFSIEFDVEPGKTSYLGSFVFSATHLVGATVTAVRVDYANAFSEDMDALKNKYSNVNIDISMAGEKEGLVLGELGGNSSISWNTIPIFL
ncbi:hypothetical protein [Microbulbifer marinus]|uniref:DUF2846 domain-containing protein n=1 Tax=Microbulbifer marinus TaxID=658218 RepID=A0A1H3Z5Z9_9GAMM|nr:hypothetical protein [Microbulbifer marinus]SEA19095.1 hypothetical protein SAMN05216562_2213 [Microbulbifer marinus]